MIGRRKTKVKKINKKKGFSLVELIVVVVIVLILTGIGSYSIGKFNRMRETTELRDYIADRLKLAKNLSVTNQLPNKTVDLKYVRVTFLNNNLTVEGIKNDGTGTTQTPYFSEKITDGNQSKISLTNNLTTVTSFGFLGKSGRLTNDSGVLSSGPLKIKISNGYGDYGLIINDLGIIDYE